MLRPGLAIGGYQLVEPLGQGGFGAVWLARGRDTRLVALKILHRELLAATHPAKGPSVLDRFLAEARLMKDLEHPNLVRIYEVIEDPGQGIAAYAMECLSGADLAKCSASFDLAQLLEIFGTVADTVAFLHEHGVVHRDLKPQNIFVTDPKVGPAAIKLLDFGAAKQLFATGEVQSTGTGVYVGTIQTMAPEMFGSGERTTPASDQWGLGVSLYFCLTDRLPFESHSMVELVDRIQNAKAAPLEPARRFELDRFPDDLAELLDRCLAKDPALRFSSMRELGAALRSIPAPSDTAEMETVKRPSRVADTRKLDALSVARQPADPRPPRRLGVLWWLIAVALAGAFGWWLRGLVSA